MDRQRYIREIDRLELAGGAARARLADALEGLKPKPRLRPMLLTAGAAVAVVGVAALALMLLPGLEQGALPPVTGSALTEAQALQTNAPAQAGTRVDAATFYAKLHLSAPSASDGWQWEYHLTPEEPDRLGYIRGVKGETAITFVTVHEAIAAEKEGDFHSFFKDGELVLRIKELPNGMEWLEHKPMAEASRVMEIHCQEEPWILLHITPAVPSGLYGQEEEEAIRKLGIEPDEYYRLRSEYYKGNGLQQIVS